MRAECARHRDGLTPGCEHSFCPVPLSVTLARKQLSAQCSRLTMTRQRAYAQVYPALKGVRVRALKSPQSYRLCPIPDLTQLLCIGLVATAHGRTRVKRRVSDGRA